MPLVPDRHRARRRSCPSGSRRRSRGTRAGGPRCAAAKRLSPGLLGQALRQRPGGEHAVVLEAQVPVQAPRAVLVDHEARRPSRGAPRGAGAGSGVGAEVAFRPGSASSLRVACAPSVGRALDARRLILRSSVLVFARVAADRRDDRPAAVSRRWPSAASVATLALHGVRPVEVSAPPGCPPARRLAAASIGDRARYGRRLLPRPVGEIRFGAGAWDRRRRRSAVAAGVPAKRRHDCARLSRCGRRRLRRRRSPAGVPRLLVSVSLAECCEPRARRVAATSWRCAVPPDFLAAGSGAFAAAFFAAVCAGARAWLCRRPRPPRARAPRRGSPSARSSGRAPARATSSGSRLHGDLLALRLALDQVEHLLAVGVAVLLRLEVAGERVDQLLGDVELALGRLDLGRLARSRRGGRAGALRRRRSSSPSRARRPSGAARRAAPWSGSRRARSPPCRSRASPRAAAGRASRRPGRGRGSRGGRRRSGRSGRARRSPRSRSSCVFFGSSASSSPGSITT